MATKNGTVKNDKLIGTASNDQINGMGGNDTLTGNAGDDVIDGGTGEDTATFGDSIYDYYITSNYDGYGNRLVVLQYVGSNETFYGTDTLTNVELLKFSDGTFNVTDIFSVDYTAPDAPTLDVVADDNVIEQFEKDAGVVMMGTVEANAEVRLNFENGTIYSTWANEYGNWAYALTPDNYASAGTDNILYIVATATDAAGNTSGGVGVEIVVPGDSIAPNAPTLDVVADDNVIEQFEKDAGVVMTGTVEANAEVRLNFENGTIYSTWANEYGNWAYALTLDNYASAGTDNILYIVATATDAAGNTSGGVGVEIVVPGDSIAPDAPTLDVVADDNVIEQFEKDAGVVMTGTVEANAEVRLNFENGTIYSTWANEYGNWAYALTPDNYASAGTDNILYIVATATDAAGNTSGGVGVEIVVPGDSIAPDAPTLDVVADDNVIEQFEKDAGVVMTGTVEANAEVRLNFENGTIYSTWANEYGNWAYALTLDNYASAGIDNILYIVATATDAAGNTSGGVGVEIVVQDSTPPDPPSFYDDFPVSEDNSFIDLSGEAEAGSTVNLTFEDGSVYDVTTGGDGFWSYELTSVQYIAAGTDSILSVVATATDAAGNISVGVGVDITVPDVVAPSAPSFYTVTDDNVIDQYERDAGVVLTGIAEAGVQISLVFNSSVVEDVFADSEGNWSYGLTDTDYAVATDVLSIDAIATDPVGNHSEPNRIDIIVAPPINTPAVEEYRLSLDPNTVKEGESAIFRIDTTNVADGTEVPFNATGSISNNDLITPLVSSFIVYGGVATLPVSFQKDKRTEGEETLTLTLNDGQSATVSVQDTSTTPVQAPPTGTVTVKGTPKQGEKLSVGSTLKDPNGFTAGSLKYQWLQNGAPIKGATLSSYVPTASDVGKAIKVKVSYVDGLGKTESKTSEPTMPVQSGEPTYDLTVDKVTVNEGESNDESAIATFTLTTKSVLVDTEVPIQFSGTISDADVLGELTTTHFTVDENGKATIPVSFINDKLTEGTEDLTLTLLDNPSQTATVSVEDTSFNTNHPPSGTVSIKGTPKQGETLSLSSTVKDADGFKAGSLKYQWFKDGSVIKGATSKTYVLTAADVNKTITAKMSYTDGLGNAESKTSAATSPVTSSDGSTTTEQPVIAEVVTPTKGATTGDDKLKGGDGNEVLTGLAGDDTIEGLAGKDTLNGSEGNDSLNGGTGNDKLFGGDGKDTLIGESGDDSLDGGKGSDELSGGKGNDTLIGGLGADIMKGEDGDDTYDVDHTDDKVIDDKASAGGTDTIQTKLSSLDMKLFPNIENLTYTSNERFLAIGNEENNQISGGIEDDKLVGGSGMDTLIGNNGDDTLDGGFGKDSLIGGAGGDTYILNNDGDVIVEKAGDDGSDVIETTASFDLSKNPTIEFLRLQGNDVINGTGNSSNNTLEGNDKNNELAGMKGNDKLFGNGGDDTLSGGEGDDTLDGGSGHDKVEFDDQQDNYNISFDKDSGRVDVDYTSGELNDGTDTLINIENLAFSDVTFNIVNGTSSDNTLAATIGNDIFIGQSGKDSFVFSNKTTSVFVDNNTKSYDSIQDFNSADGDKIDFSKFDSNEKTAGIQHLKFATGDKFTKIAQVRFDKSAHELLINTDTDNAPEFVIVLNGVTSVSSSDLML